MHSPFTICGECNLADSKMGQIRTVRTSIHDQQQHCLYCFLLAVRCQAGKIYLVRAAIFANDPHLAAKMLLRRHRRALLFQNACMARNMKDFRLHVFAFAVLQELVFMQIGYVATTKLNRCRSERGNC